MEGPSVEKVEFRVQLQHQSTWWRACPPALPVYSVPKPPVGVSPLLPPLPDGWSAFLDDGDPLAISQVFQACLDNGDRNLHWGSTPVSPTHMPLPTILPQHCSRGCVCLCVCVCVLLLLLIYRYIYWLIEGEIYLYMFSYFSLWWLSSMRHFWYSTNDCAPPTYILLVVYRSLPLHGLRTLWAQTTLYGSMDPHPIFGLLFFQ